MDIQRSFIPKKSAQKPKARENSEFDLILLGSAKEYLQSMYLSDLKNDTEPDSETTKTISYTKMEIWLSELIKILTRRCVAIPLTNLLSTVQQSLKMFLATHALKAEVTESLNAQILWFFISILHNYDYIQISSILSNEQFN